MTYNLTSLLTTIASSSAGIVAILGGFIASKLISISGERDSVLSRIHEIDEELRFVNEDIEKRQLYIDKEDALTYIIEHISELFDMKPLSEIFCSSEKQILPFDKLEQLWNHALCIRNELTENAGLEDYAENNDGIPTEVAKKYAADDFSYTILKALVNEANRRVEKEKRKQSQKRWENSPFQIGAAVDSMFDFMPIKEDISFYRPVLDKRYDDNKGEIYKLSERKKLLAFQKRQIEIQKLSLKRPKGMKSGLVIFLLFSVFDIILPLVFCTVETENVQFFVYGRIIAIILFSAGLLSVFCYLVWLLSWKEGD